MENWAKYKPNFRYMMLSHLKQDCDYYLGNGNRSTNALWSRNEAEWLTKDDITNYARQMGVDYD